MCSRVDREGTNDAVPRPAPPRSAAQGASTAPQPAPAEDLDGWVKVLELDEVAPGEVVEVLAGDRALAVANVDGEVYAVDSVCPHAGGPLGDGHLQDCVLTCPWHGWTFDVRTGASELADDVVVATFPTRVVGGAIYVQGEPP